MKNCDYNKLKLAHLLSQAAGFAEKFGKTDARKDRHGSCKPYMQQLSKDMHGHIKKLLKGVKL